MENTTNYGSTLTDHIFPICPQYRMIFIIKSPTMVHLKISYYFSIRPFNVMFREGGRIIIQHHVTLQNFLDVLHNYPAESKFFYLIKFYQTNGYVHKKINSSLSSRFFCWHVSDSLSYSC